MCGWKEGAGYQDHHHHHHHHHHHDEIEGGVRGWRYGEFPWRGIATASRKGREENSLKKKVGKSLKKKIGKSLKKKIGK